MQLPTIEQLLAPCPWEFEVGPYSFKIEAEDAWYNDESHIVGHALIFLGLTEDQSEYKSVEYYGPQGPSLLDALDGIRTQGEYVYDDLATAINEVPGLPGRLFEASCEALKQQIVNLQKELDDRKARLINAEHELINYRLQHPNTQLHAHAIARMLGVI